jgi:inosine/xanthosine triphosphate pyrophosphatase family protein
LKDDPGETMNIAKSNPEKVKELKAILDKKLAESNAKFPISAQ